MQHDNQKIALDIQHRLIKYILKKNFKIVPLYECIGETIDRISFRDNNEVSIVQFVTLNDINNLVIFYFIIFCSIFIIVVFLKIFNKNELYYSSV